MSKNMSLLIPKLQPPRLHASLFPRNRLLSLLDQGLSRKLTLLSAPAGFGKTTLLSTWLAARSNKLPAVGWVALDAGDNDSARFWHYLITACQKFQPELGSVSLALLQQSSFSKPSPEALLTPLLNELALIPGNGILVLEDYHLISEPEIHQGMSFLLNHLPANIHLIIITRAEPPLPLAQLRVQDELVELGATQLRFTAEETQTFLQRTLPFPLKSSTLDQFQERTEGWAAGLRLITLALQSQGPAAEQKLTTIHGSQRHLLDYLVSEVLPSQPEEVQTFLLQTTGLPRLTSSLCDFVTGRMGSESLLERVEKAGLFLVPLDDKGQWYRYHALFAEAMQHEARRRLGEDAQRTFASKASLWYEQHGDVADAIESALAAREFEQAAMLLTRYLEGLPFHQINEHYTLICWFEALPEDLLQNSPLLSQIYAISLLFNNRQHSPALKAQIEKYFRLAEEHLRLEGNFSHLGEALVLHALAAEKFNDIETVHRCTQEALEILPANEKGWAWGMIAWKALLAGRYADAQQAAQAARVIFSSIDNSYARRGALLQQANLALGLGNLEQAGIILREVAEDASEDPTDQSAALHGLATISYEWNQLVVAEQQTQQAFAASQLIGYELLQIQTTILQARILYARGQSTQARELLQRFIITLTQTPWQREVELWLAQFALSDGDLITAQRWLGSHHLSENIYLDTIREHEALLTARLLISQRKAQEALSTLNHWLKEARSQYRLRSEVEILLLTSRLYEAQQQKQEARETLKTAIALAQPPGYRRLFLDEGEEIIPLLKTVTPELPVPAQATFARNLLHAFAHENQPSPTGTAMPPIEQISPQEKRVLRLLIAGRSNPEIARELVVSVNTIKAQVKSIYRKLGVSNRLEASDVARRQRLL
jgi:LuxR family maltose regulon positive regulatory protein